MTILRKIATDGCGCDAPDHLGTLIGIDEALGRIAQQAGPVAGTEKVPLMQARGRVLAEPVRAACMTPPFDNAAMDGYAVDTAAFTGQGPWTFRVGSRVPAGAAAPDAVGDRDVARIFTGAPVPPGADAVIRQEDACRAGDSVSFDKRPARGGNIRRAGGDMQAGQIVLQAGTRLCPRAIAACAAAGAGMVAVRRTLRVALLVTGDEVREAGTARRAADIWDVNTPMLRGVLAGPGIDLVHVAHVADRRDLLDRGLADLAGRVDLIVTTGGVSVGEEDHVKPALSALGAELYFSGVAIKPGKPISYGRIGATHWLGLPGNPLSAFVTWQIFGDALIRQLAGQRGPLTSRRHVVTGEAIHRKAGRCEIRPAFLTGFDALGREVADIEAATHSGRVGRLALADGLVFLPADADRLPAGALVEFLPFHDN